MKKVPLFLSRHKLSFITMVVTFLLILIALSVSFSGFNTSLGSFITPLNHWIKAHKIIFILWHISILLAIYFAWGYKVDYAAKQHKLQEKTIKKIKRFRWLMIACVLIIDAFMFL